jgi:hypothetical protein
MKSFFKKLLHYWKIFAVKLGAVQNFIILSIVYWIVLGLTAILSKFFASDLLKKKIKQEPTFWENKQHPLPATPETLRRQF